MNEAAQANEGTGDRMAVTAPGLWNRGPEGWWLRYRLHRASGIPTVAFHYRTMTADFESSVTRFADFIERLPATPVDLVGHSLGGLLVLGVLGRLPPETFGRVVLLGAPVNGSRAVRDTLRNIPGGRWMIGRNAPLLAGGLGLTPPEGVDVGVLAGSGGVGVGRVVTRFDGLNDGTIAVAETRFPPARDSVILPVTHTGMLFSRAVAAQSAHFLVHGRFDHGAGEVVDPGGPTIPGDGP